MEENNTQEEKSPEEMKSKKKMTCSKMKPLVAGIVAAAIIAVGGVYAYTYSQAKQLVQTDFVVKSAAFFSIDVATINGTSISYGNYLKNMEILRHVYNAQAGGASALPEETLSDLAISQSFVEKLTDELLEKYNLTLTQEDLDVYKNELIDGLGGEDAAKAEILTRFGLSFEDYIQYVLTPYAKEEKAKLAYDQNSETIPEDVLREKAQALKDQIASGERTFEEIASEVNVDASKEVGGDLGWFTKGTMVQEFEDVAFSQEIGVISDPVLTDFGLHLIKVVEKRTTTTPNGQEEEVRASHIHLSPYADAVPYEEYRRQMLSNSKIELQLPIHDPFDGILKQ